MFLIEPHQRFVVEPDGIGVVPLSERKIRVRKPRLRKKGKGNCKEVPVPAYVAMQENSRLVRRITDILMKGLSASKYKTPRPPGSDHGLSHDGYQHKAGRHEQRPGQPDCNTLFLECKNGDKDAKQDAHLPERHHITRLIYDLVGKQNE